VKSIHRYQAGGGGDENSIQHAVFLLNGQEFICIDSPVKHAFSFTPAISIYVNCESEAEIENLFNGLSENGKILMQLGPYPFSKKFGWAEDRFGISWQLNFS
jgi:predicted 3-demethylubiquinone-9 3-methyltransferase (glyoxalase superfamily)